MNAAPPATDAPPARYDDLRALVINRTLKLSPEVPFPPGSGAVRSVGVDPRSRFRRDPCSARPIAACLPRRLRRARGGLGVPCGTARQCSAGRRSGPSGCEPPGGRPGIEVVRTGLDNARRVRREPGAPLPRRPLPNTVKPPPARRRAEREWHGPRRVPRGRATCWRQRNRSSAVRWWTGSRVLRHHLKELRPGSSGSGEIRIVFAFDPVRRAVLLVAGDKAGNWQRWYDINIPLAEERYQAHLADLETREYE